MRTRYQILKDFFCLYGAMWAMLPISQIIYDLTGKQFISLDYFTKMNPYTFFGIIALLLVVAPYAESYGKRKTLNDFYPSS